MRDLRERDRERDGERERGNGREREKQRERERDGWGSRGVDFGRNHDQCRCLAIRRCFRASVPLKRLRVTVTPGYPGVT